MKKYDFIIVGSGLFGSVCAHELLRKNYKVLVLEKRDHVGGNVYTQKIDGINVHKYGAHIFHTDNEYIWNYINRFGKFNNYINEVIAIYKDEKYNLPFNMNTFKQIWGDVQTVEDAKNHIQKEIKEYGVSKPSNLEEQAISMVGKTIYTKLIKEYTEKQWNKPCNELPPEIIKRIPVRYENNNNYFNDKYQGIPIDGYTSIINKMLDGVEVQLNTDYINNKDYYDSICEKIIYTGSIDELFNYEYGKLEYRSLKFIEKTLNKKTYQGNAVINYTSHDVPYTRIIEHKFFNNDKSDKTIIYEEYPDTWAIGKERFYPLNDECNTNLYLKYKGLVDKNPKLILGGRLGLYKYYDMDDTIEAALSLVKNL